MATRRKTLTLDDKAKVSRVDGYIRVQLKAPGEAEYGPAAIIKMPNMAGQVPTSHRTLGYALGRVISGLRTWAGRKVHLET